MSQLFVRAGFENKLSVWAAAQNPAWVIAFENQVKAPLLPYLKSDLIPARVRDEFLEGGHRSFSGIYQVSIITAIGVGPGPAEVVAAALDTLYGKQFVYNGLRIYLLEPMSVAKGYPDQNKFIVPVSAPYRADIVL